MGGISAVANEVFGTGDSMAEAYNTAAENMHPLWTAQIAADAQKYAADLQNTASQNSIAELRRQYDVMTQQLQPYVDAGKQGLDKFTQMVNAGPGDYTKSPGYDFRLKQGTDTMMKSASARGVLNNPQTMKSLNEYGQNYATADYDNFLNRYYQSLAPQQSLAAMGQSSAARSGQAGIDVASSAAGISSANAANIGNQAINSANTQANIISSGQTAQANLGVNAAASRASGYNNLSNAFQGMGNSAAQLGMMYGQSGGGGGWTGGSAANQAGMYEAFGNYGYG
jgi:hypothetical protein